MFNHLWRLDQDTQNTLLTMTVANQILNLLRCAFEKSLYSNRFISGQDTLQISTTTLWRFNAFQAPQYPRVPSLSFLAAIFKEGTVMIKHCHLLVTTFK